MVPSILIHASVPQFHNSNGKKGPQSTPQARYLLAILVVKRVKTIPTAPTCFDTAITGVHISLSIMSSRILELGRSEVVVHVMSEEMGRMGFDGIVVDIQLYS